MKTIAVTVDERTLKHVDELVASSRRLRNRSAAVRLALQEFTERERRRQLEERERTIFRTRRRQLARQAQALIGEQARP
jgi:Arc/MetJ-type ribon-helix-helix transcriptional regulator